MQVKALLFVPLMALGCQASLFPSTSSSRGQNYKGEDTVTISSEIPIPTSTIEKVATVTETVRDVVTVTKQMVETAVPNVVSYQLDEHEAPRAIHQDDYLLERVVIDVVTANGNLTKFSHHNDASMLQLASVPLLATALFAALTLW